jgi:hypothetical protein
MADRDPAVAGRHRRRAHQLLDQDEQGRFARMYTLVTRFNEAEQREQDAWAQLRALETWRGPLGDAGRVHFVSALQQARYELWEISLTVQIARDSAKELGLKNLHPTVQAGRDIPHAVCLPITTSRDDALRVLNDNDFGQPK